MDDRSVDSPFSEAANFYEFRAPYAPQALAYVRDALQLDNTSRALDLGCGPGTIAIPLVTTLKVPSASLTSSARARSHSMLSRLAFAPSPRSAFGDRTAFFERDLTDALLRANPSGVFKERLETEVLIARKMGA
jgi:hypothetical protein